MKDSLGLPCMTKYYLEVNDGDDKREEWVKIMKVIYYYSHTYASKNNIDEDDIEVDFINYGKTELVFVMTIQNKERYTLLVKQPKVPMGKVKKEADYLKELHTKDSLVVAPIDYLSVNNDYIKSELYVTPYIYQARCIASYNESWGAYIPEPTYRFVIFDDEQRFIVNKCMIAKLVYLYDENKEEGISKVRCSGGDFMLPKNWELSKPTVDNTLNNLYLIACRDKVHCSLEEYIDIIRKEFIETNINEDQSEIIINSRSRASMSEYEIEEGIRLGLKLRKDKKERNLKKEK